MVKRKNIYLTGLLPIPMNFIGPLWMYVLLDEICELLYIGNWYFLWPSYSYTKELLHVLTSRDISWVLRILQDQLFETMIMFLRVINQTYEFLSLIVCGACITNFSHLPLQNKVAEQISLDPFDNYDNIY